MSRILLFSTLSIFILIASSLRSQYAGSYDIYPDGTGDFIDLPAMADALNGEGVSGAVTIRLHPGTYSDQIVLNVPSVGENSPLIIEGATGNPMDVIIQYYDAPDSAQHVFRFEAMSHVTVRHITFDTEESDNGTVIDIRGDSQVFTIHNNRFIGDRNGSAVVFGQGLSLFDFYAVMDDLTVTENYFTLFSPAVYSPTFALQKHHRLTVNSNEFADADALTAYGVDDLVIQDNVQYGILYNVAGFNLGGGTGAIIERNELHDSYESILLFSDTGTVDLPFIVRNNFFNGGGQLLGFSSSVGLQVAHNTFRSDDDEAQMIQPGFENVPSVEVVNNLFYQANPEGGFMSSGFGTEEPQFFSKNAWYTNGYFIAYYDTTTFELIEEEDFEAFKDLANLSDDNLVVDPVFASDSNLHVASTLLNVGLPLSYVNEDIDGDIRSTVTPTIGADEISGAVAGEGLVLDTVMALTDAFEGQGLLVQWDVDNVGGQTFYGPWEDKVWLSADSELDAQDYLLDSVQYVSNLSGGSNYTRQITVTLPLGYTGTYFLIAKIDSDTQLFDDNSDNVKASAPISIGETAKPDLRVTDISLPENPQSGTEIIIQWTVINEGDAATQSAWTDKWYLANDPAVFDDPENIEDLQLVWDGQLTAPTGLAPGESYTSQVSFELPVDLGGQHYVLLYTDRNDAIGEGLGEENNSLLSDVMFVVQSPLPDLVVTDITVPSTSFAGQTIPISYTVENIGEANTVPTELPFNFFYGYTWAPLLGYNWLDYIYLRDTTLLTDLSDYDIVSGYDSADLLPDESYTISAELTLPECISGEYYIHLSTDRWGHIQEGAEVNNDAVSESIDVILNPTPDLTPLALEVFSDELYSGQELQVGYEVINYGPASLDFSEDSWHDQIYLSPVDTLNSDLLTAVATSTYGMDVAVDETYSITSTVTLPEDLIGSMYLVLFVDGGNDLCEGPFEDNNARFIPVEIFLTPPSDLLLSSSSEVPASLSTGEVLEVQWTVTNQGVGPTTTAEWVDKLVLLDDEDGALWQGTTLDQRQNTQILSPGEGYTWSSSVTIPLNLDTGLYRLYHIIDEEDEVYEHEAEENNTQVFEIVISHDESQVSDLEAQGCTWSATPISGEMLSISFEVENTSASTEISAWYDKLKLRSLNGQNLAETQALHIGLVQAGGSYTGMANLMIPDGLEGLYELVLEVDTAGVVLEYDLENNRSVTEIDISLAPSPDLVAQSISVPAEVAAGQEFSLAYMIENLGAADISASPWTDRVYLSTDNLYDENDLWLKSFDQGGDLPNMAGYTMDTLVRVPLTVQGSFFVIVVADAIDDIYEHDAEQNNYIVSEDPLMVSLAPPVDFDLQFSGIQDVTSSISSFTVTVTNTSGNDAEGSWTSAIYLSDDDQWDVDDPLIGVHDVGIYPWNVQSPLNAGESYSQFIGVSVPPSKEGVYHYIIRYDRYNYVNESNETNNTFVSQPFFVDNIPLIVPDVLYTEQFYPFGKDYFKIDVPEEYGVLLKMRHVEVQGLLLPDQDPIHDIKVREGDIPSALHYDFSTLTPLQEDHDVLVSVDDYSRRDFIQTSSLYIPPHYDPDSISRAVYTLQAELKEFSTYVIFPDTVGNLHNITLRVDGFDFDDSLRVELRSTTDTIVAYETYTNSTEHFTTYIDTRDHAPGDYDLYIEKVNQGASYTSPAAVYVQEGGTVEPFISVEAPELVRIAQGMTAKVSYGNLGAINGYDWAVVVAFYREENPTTDDLKVSFLGSDAEAYADSAADPMTYGEYEVIDHGNMMIYSAYIPVFNNDFRGELFFDVDLDAEDYVWSEAFLWQLPRSEFTVSGRLEDYVYSAYPYLLDSIIVEDIGLPVDLFRSVNTDCSKVLRVENMEKRIASEVKKVAEEARGAKGFLKDLNDNLTKFFNNKEDALERAIAAKDVLEARKKFDLAANDDTPFATEIQDVFNCIDTEGRTCSRSEPNPCSYRYSCWIDGQEQVEWRSNGQCQDANPQKKKSWKTRFVESLDPNAIEGPAGITSIRMVEQEHVMPYKIWFENTETATAPAVRVRIDNPLPEEALIQSFRLTGFGFGDEEYTLEPTPFVQEVFELGPDYDGQLLRLVAGVDPVGAEAFWEFTTLDPNTGEETIDPLGGFLPPNDSTDIGQAWVTYEVRLKPEQEEGTEVLNQAVIIFDDNEEIETNVWSNVIGEATLLSRVDVLPTFSDPSFKVNWTAELNEGISVPVASFNIFVQKDDGPIKRWKTTTTQRQGIFSGEEGHTYHFYSQAIAEGGEVEPFHSAFDTKTTVQSFPLNPSADNPFLLYPNPSTDLMYLQYYVAEDAEVSLEIYDLAGRMIYSEYMGMQQAGSYGQRFEELLSAGFFIAELRIGDKEYKVKGLRLD